MLFPLVYKRQQQGKYSENLYTLKIFVTIMTDSNSTYVELSGNMKHNFTLSYWEPNVPLNHLETSCFNHNSVCFDEMCRK